MSSGTKHTISAFDDDMDEIRGLIAEMGARAESAVIAAMKALREHDTDAATTIRAQDKIIDALETEVERLVVRTIALRAPMADDLRELIAALKMSAVIERIGDYAKNIAKRVPQNERQNSLVRHGSAWPDGRNRCGNDPHRDGRLCKAGRRSCPRCNCTR
jgi:phosphate transport system protein